MLSQAMESVTRAFYTRSDLEFVLSAPVRADRVFAVRIGAVALSAIVMSAFLMGPFIDILALEGGARWLGAYGVLVGVSLVSTSLAVILTVVLFRLLGPKRTRLVAQIVAAVIGGAFVIGLQIAALFSTGTTSRLAFLQSRYVMTHVPGIDSLVWWPARAVLGDLLAMAVVAGAGIAFFVVVTARFAPSFAEFALQVGSISHASTVRNGVRNRFDVRAPSSALRHKERLLLLRDPWLMSQSLMQILYLIPPALLLMKSFSDGSAALVLVPVLIMAAGQLAGGLAWLTISGEDAPELMGSSPLDASRSLRAKIEAVLQCVAVVFLPLVLILGVVSLKGALIASIGIAAAAASSSSIQFWFRSQASRSQFRRRHTSSRIATLSEAFVSITWAGAGAVAAGGSLWAALIVVAIAAAILFAVRSFSPSRAVASAA
jgi:ABC-2 type transport system permease protein